jgi:3-hydroxymyristoyl/3-hydroxydecanoyl-(acyl carrier protein) dehydratase
MAQAAGYLARLLVTDAPYGHRLLTRIKRAKFRRPVRPGDSLRVNVRLLNRFNRSTAFTVTVGVETARMAEADFYFFHF